ncbi:type II secretion system F family protein [Parapedobacter koreensis]|uniref:General secretion pathway protein F n=1 Tax=Parapedobacter koreensis TaxID=332977 RepID=A0A1H7I0M3_9SPHI|nr:type II secretion system F family protein [Parapedobacter koreensis]SEK54950.1 type IV pilus assembly protein PilC [Parapedobacter koreensis]
MSNGIDIKKIKVAATPAAATTTSAGQRNTPKLAAWLTKDYTLFSPFGDKQKESLYHELGILLQAGIDLKAAFDMLISQQQNKKNAAMLTEVQSAVVQGSSLSAAMQQHKPFTPYEYHSVQIGEETGKIAAVLQDLARFFRKRLKQKRQITSALTYPFIVMLTSFGAIFFMMNFIVPMFADIFQRSGNALPPITQLIVSVSEVSRNYAPLIILALAALSMWLYLRRNNAWNRRWTAWLMIRLPVFGGMIRKVYVARFCNSMALLTGSKIPLIRALQLCRQMVGFYPIEHSLIAVEDRVMHGHPLHSSLAAFPIYDTKLVSLVKVGEEVNQLADFFGKVADQYNDEVEYQSATIAALLEPLIIVFLGLFVGLILIAMYLPMFQMGDTFG